MLVRSGWNKVMWTKQRCDVNYYALLSYTCHQAAKCLIRREVKILIKKKLRSRLHAYGKLRQHVTRPDYEGKVCHDLLCILLILISKLSHGSWKEVRIIHQPEKTSLLSPSLLTSSPIYISMFASNICWNITWAHDRIWGVEWKKPLTSWWC
jgi:hypothetical protein